MKKVKRFGFKSLDEVLKDNLVAVSLFIDTTHD